MRMASSCCRHDGKYDHLEKLKIGQNSMNSILRSNYFENHTGDQIWATAEIKLHRLNMKYMEENHRYRLTSPCEIFVFIFDKFEVFETSLENGGR